MPARRKPESASLNRAWTWLEPAEIDLIRESLRMMAEQLMDASATVSRVMPEAQILERFADWREQALDLRERLQA